MLAGLAFLLWKAFLQPRPADADVLSGYVEGEALYLSSPLPGAVTSLSVARGQRVAANAPLFSVDARATQAQKLQAQAQIDQTLAQVRTAQAGADQQKASLAQAEIEAANAARDAQRFAGAAADKTGAVSTHDLDQARTAADRAQAQKQAAAQALQGAQTQVDAARTAVTHAQGALAEVQARLDQLSARAPSPGRIEETFFQVGEWAPANQPILSLIPDGKVKLRFYVPERVLAAYQFGRTVAFGCDGCKAGQEAVIDYVSPRPEYTPPVIYSRRSRDRLMFLIEARPRDAAGLTPGLPVDVTPLGATTP